MTVPPPSAPPPEFTTSIRLPPHRLEIDEAKFLRLLARTFCLTKADKRLLLATLPQLTQEKADRLIELWAAAEHRLAREGHPVWETLRSRVAAEWRGLERERST